MHDNIEIGNKSMETVEYFEYFGKTIANQDYIHDEIKGRLDSGNAYHSSVQLHFYSSLLPKIER